PPRAHQRRRGSRWRGNRRTSGPPPNLHRDRGRSRARARWPRVGHLSSPSIDSRTASHPLCGSSDRQCSTRPRDARRSDVRVPGTFPFRSRRAVQMTATLTPTVGTPTSKASWLPRLIPGVLRLNRTALISVAVIYLAFTAVALTVVHQVGHPRAIILAGEVFNGTLYSVSTYAFYLPVLVAVFIGAPMFARPLETGTFRFAWTQGVGRRRLVATTLMVFVVELTVLSIPLGIILSRLWFDLSPQFWNVWANHVFFTNPWMMTFSSVIGLL